MKKYKVSLSDVELRNIIFYISNEIDIQKQFIKDAPSGMEKEILIVNVENLKALKDKLNKKLNKQ